MQLSTSHIYLHDKILGQLVDALLLQFFAQLVMLQLDICNSWSVKDLSYLFQAISSSLRKNKVCDGEEDDLSQVVSVHFSSRREVTYQETAKYNIVLPANALETDRIHERRDDERAVYRQQLAGESFRSC